jgi:hypothetical protein
MEVGTRSQLQTFIQWQGGSEAKGLLEAIVEVFLYWILNRSTDSWTWFSSSSTSQQSLSWKCKKSGIWLRGNIEHFLAMLEGFHTDMEHVDVQGFI